MLTCRPLLVAVLATLGLSPGAEAQLRPFVVGLTLERAPFVDQRGRALDSFSAPDFQPVLVDEGGIDVVRGHEYSDVRPHQFPLRWSFGAGAPLDLDRSVAVAVYDPDTGTGGADFVGGTYYVSVRRWQIDSGEEYPASLYLTGEPGAGLAATVELAWR